MLLPLPCQSGLPACKEQALGLPGLTGKPKLRPTGKHEGLVGGLRTSLRCLQEKLRLEEDDEVAIEWMQQLINESSSQVMANIMETTHRWAQALR